MKILIIHNYYQQWGGEDSVFESEINLLEKNGHTVVRYTKNNKDVSQYSNLKLALYTIWNPIVYKEIKEIINKHHPDIAHFHNTLPLISPAAYYACRKLKVPVIQSLHNFRFLCPKATLYRDNRICELCLNKNIPYPSLLYSCYRGDFKSTLVLNIQKLVHMFLGTYSKTINYYIALSEFSKNKFVQGGFTSKKIFVKPNFVYENKRDNENLEEAYYIYMGRISEEKGISFLIDSWMKYFQDFNLKIIGDGPLRKSLESKSKDANNISWLGFKENVEALKYLKKAFSLIFPSQCYEGFGLTIIEAFSVGTPVIANNIGSPREIITDQKNGLVFNYNDPIDLLNCVNRVSNDKEFRRKISNNAKKTYQSKYSEKQNVLELEKIYTSVIKNFS